MSRGRFTPGDLAEMQQYGIDPLHPFARADLAALRRPENRGDPKADGTEPPGQMRRDDPMPAGPFRLSFTSYPNGERGWPYLVLAGNGQCVAGWCGSYFATRAIVTALNLQYPT